MDTADFSGAPPESDPSNTPEPKQEIVPPKPIPGAAQPEQINRGRRRRNRRGPGGRPGQQPAARQERPPRQNGQGNNRRRGAVFTGPMDHSYRQQNGEAGNSLNDSGNQSRFKGRGGRFRPQFGKNRGSQQGFQTKASQHFHSNLDPVPYREDATTRIFAFVDDLFFMTKIMDTAKKLNVKVEFVKTLEELQEKVISSAEEKPSLVIFDLNNVNAKPLATIPKVKSKFKKGTSILGFVSHVQGDLKMKAQEAGCDSVMPRSAFSQNLPQILRRHGAPEELDQTE
jgi:hypothetical protein